MFVLVRRYAPHEGYGQLLRYFYRAIDREYIRNLDAELRPEVRTTFDINAMRVEVRFAFRHKTLDNEELISELINKYGYEKEAE